MHKIAVHTKRIGGGFGGKESRSAFVNAAIAVPAHHLRRPVRVVLDRDEDMQIMGQRHAFMGRYKVTLSIRHFHANCGHMKAIQRTLQSFKGRCVHISLALRFWLGRELP